MTAAPDDSDAPFNPDWGVHPGDILRDIMDERHTSVEGLAAYLGWPLWALERFLAGTMDVTPSAAAELANATGTSRDYWLNLQKFYDEWRAKHVS